MSAYAPSTMTQLLWETAAAKTKIEGLRGAARVERLVGLAELQVLLSNALDMTREALKEIEVEIHAGSEGEQRAEGEAR